MERHAERHADDDDDDEARAAGRREDLYVGKQILPKSMPEPCRVETTLGNCLGSNLINALERTRRGSWELMDFGTGSCQRRV